MSNHLTYLDKIVLTSILAVFSGTLLALIVNTIDRVLIRKEIYPGSIKDGFLSSIAMALFAGCLIFGLGSFDIQSIEDTEIQSTFILLFVTSFFSGAADTLIKIVKLVFSTILSLDNSD